MPSRQINNGNWNIAWLVSIVRWRQWLMYREIWQSVLMNVIEWNLSNNQKDKKTTMEWNWTFSPQLLWRQTGTSANTNLCRSQRRRSPAYWREDPATLFHSGIRHERAAYFSELWLQRTFLVTAHPNVSSADVGTSSWQDRVCSFSLKNVIYLKCIGRSWVQRKPQTIYSFRAVLWELN